MVVPLRQLPLDSSLQGIDELGYRVRAGATNAFPKACGLTEPFSLAVARGRSARRPSYVFGVPPVNPASPK
jgi:hypothetical protein